MSTHVYQREVHAGADDSLAKITNMIPAGSRVLDVGTGSGALGRRLGQATGHVVDGITYNEAEAAVASPHYRQLLVIDLEREALLGRFQGEQYDVIVCADVLEHLRNANQVLQDLGALLKPGGRVLLSLPNVTHLGVVLGLLAGRFVRTHEGLLDSTHVHFMDRVALHNLVQGAGFQVVHEDAVRRDLIDTEFAALDFQALPLAVRDYVNALPDADVYQFIWTLAPGLVQPAGQSSDAVIDPPKVPQIVQVPRFRTQLFVDRGHGFGPVDCIDAFGEQREGLQTLTYPVSDGAQVQAMRLDFSDRPGQMEFVYLRALDESGKLLWQWDGDWSANIVYHQSAWTGVRGWLGGRMVRATGNDPWVSIPLEQNAWARVSRVEVRLSAPQPLGVSDWPGLDMHELQRMLQSLANQSADRIATLDAHLASARSLADFRQTDIDALRKENDARQKTALATIESLRADLAHTQHQLQGIVNSRSWRLTAGLRWLGRLLAVGKRG